jgi:teichuronic acid biosynthesis glycosyltransferase TuaC
MRILMLSTLFPTAEQPRFGSFVEKRALMMSAQPDLHIRVVAPIGLPPFGMKFHPRYAKQRAAPVEEQWQGLHVYRPRFTHIPTTAGRFDPGNLVRALVPVLTKIRAEFPFDIIDAQFFFPDSVAAAKLGEIFGVPTTATARGSDIHYWAEQPVTGPMIVEASNRLSHVVAVSHALRADMIALGMDGDKIDVVRPGVDRSMFHPRDSAAIKAKMGITGTLLATVGSLDENKGQYLVLDALRQFPGAHYLIAGEGPYRATLEKLIEDYGLQDRARLLGNIDRESVSDLVTAADVMVLPSAHEGLANAWLEALASGTPVVLCDAGGAREVVSSEVAGRIVARNPDAIAEGIRQVLGQSFDRQQVSETVAQYNWDDKISFLLGHMKRLIAAAA